MPFSPTLPHRRLSNVTARLPGWGWLEWFVVSQTLLPALLFLPGIQPARTAIRVAAYVAAPLAWVMVTMRGRPTPGSDTFPARPWLIVSITWLVLSLFHPNIYSTMTSLAQVALHVSIVSPAFWAPRALRSPKQLSRVVTVLFLCNALSATVGILQAFRPQTFNPPVIPAMSNKFNGEDLMYQAADGRMIIRPCGLTDSPGSASPAGAVAALIGLCFALRPIAAWKRLACLALAFIGVAVIYYTQVRFPLVMLMICGMVLTGLLIYQQNYKQAVELVVGGLVIGLGALMWVARSVGSRVLERFGSLMSENPGSYYYKSRGAYVHHALEVVLWQYPLGYGMGWWGMTHAMFSDPSRFSPVWVEVMIPAWIYDGGLPLLIGYGGAVTVAMVDTIRIALTSHDRDVAFWATVVVALNLSILATCMSFLTFLSPIGLQYWLLAATVHGADRQARVAASARRPSARVVAK